MPLFSIGITTYDRVDLLKETLSSVLRQSFTDFEVIVGNDNPGRVLTPETVGVNDPRVKFINHSVNLGEVGNMNSILQSSTGRYFTLIADDDLYAPDFLKAADATLKQLNYPPCVYTAFENGSTIPETNGQTLDHAEFISARDFVRTFLARELKVIGSMGLFDREFFTSLGGFENPSQSSMALHTEYLNVVRLAATVDEIAYVDVPLILYRVHEGSWGCTNKNIDEYLVAGVTLVNECANHLGSPKLEADFTVNYTNLLKWVMIEFANASRRARPLGIRALVGYLWFSRRYLSSLRGTPRYWKGVISITRAQRWLVWTLCKQWFLASAPKALIRFVYYLRFLIQQKPTDARSET